MLRTLPAKLKFDSEMVLEKNYEAVYCPLPVSLYHGTTLNLS